MPVDARVANDLPYLCRYGTRWPAFRGAARRLAASARDNREMDADLTARLRDICLALPEVTERPSHGTPTWFVRDKKAFVTLWADGHHDDHFPHLWCAAPAGA